MLQKLFVYTFGVFFLLITVSLKAEEQKMTQIDIATRYYQALYSGEHNVVRGIASSELLFQDPTAPDELGIPPQLDGLEDFLKFMNANIQGEIDITFTDKYVSNNRVVLTVATKGTIPASLVGMGQEGSVKYETQGVSIIHILEGKVVSHTDYFNYPALTSSFRKVD